MSIKSKLTEQDFINVNFVLLYSKKSMKIFTVLISLFLVVSILTALFLPNAFSSQIFVPIAMLIAIPVLTYFGAKRNYRANKRISETIEYQFDNDYLLVKGESFNSQLTWDKVYKVTQTKNWLLIWQNRQVATPIPKSNILDEQIGELKVILEKHKVKNYL